MAEVFISYSQKDRARVAPISAGLQELGVDAWYDREISAGESFGAVIRARLKEAKAVIVCWSPEAAASDWVDSEADYARELGSYVPIFVAPCALMPPFNRIHTDDLSKWQGALGDPVWLKLVDRIARLIGREGVAAGARALAAGDDATKYAFARRYPDEPLAQKIWAGAEARLRSEFASRLAEARTAAKAKIDADRGAREARLSAATPAFEAWLAGERRGSATAEKPDPLRLVEPEADGGDKALRETIDALSSALAEANARVGELDEKKAEAARLAGEL
ncbi:MAG: TIR domain-containing protein, partial [Roseiarcus sp.]